MNLNDFGSPTTTTDYVLCLYDNVGLEMILPAPADGTCGTKPCWKPVGTKGFKYKDKSGTADGLTGIVLKASAATKSKIRVKGKGANLPVPTLQFATPVRVQLKRLDTGEYWDATYSNPIKNTATQFKARSD